MTQQAFQSIGVPGQPWGDAERALWHARQQRRRSYQDEVVAAIEGLRGQWEVVEYGRVEDAGDHYTLLALKSRDWDDALPCMLVTGGVHGYETSGVQGTLQFARLHADDSAGCANLLVVPCISPWAYERVQRWNPQSIDPNRSFRADSPAPESAALMRLVAPFNAQVLMHIDLHETTDTDESEFRPALAARDGVAFEPGSIPDGFYLVGDSANPQPEFQQAVIAAVERVTHIAPADAEGRMIGSPVVAHGVINYPVKPLGLCAGITDARYVTTTEVYPDSASATAAQCNDAQVAAIRAAIAYVLAQPQR
jgi:hypothetical protein